MGSTTLKCVVLDPMGKIIYKEYERHYSRISQKAAEMLTRIHERYPDETMHLAVSGSAGMGLAERLGLPFVQEVYATRVAVKKLLPDTDTVIELGGEDAKILFLQGGLEVRMNGSCAGGTGAFIDQMATLLDLSPDEMNELSKQHEKIHIIASRCGVFAKSDIQPLLNQGAKKSDIAASIFAAVVNQTVAGLAQGRPIAGRVLYLGGPLTFLSELRKSFDEILGVKGVCPEDSLYFVAMGAALAPGESQLDPKEAAENILRYTAKEEYHFCPPLFADKEEYDAFSKRHQKHSVPVTNAPHGGVFIGVDAGSTTIKAVAIDEDENIVDSCYLPNSGNAVAAVRQFLADFYKKYPDVQVLGAASTGYGEEIIKNAFNLDGSLVETMAHYTAAAKFLPEVDFIIDIGGQDIKCFKIKDGTIENIFLNEACSSGCGSFLQTFAGALDESIEDFAKKGLMADKPVDLGSRCTVFMNSSVKQAQKDGASPENISAGLSISVVKNALYKVIRAASAEDLGEHIVVQGGTFLNDAVLRAFENEIGREVVRPSIAGLMGAYGAALFAKKHRKNKSGILAPDEIENFTYQTKETTCGLCENHCKLTINDFGSSRRYIAGNRCERPVTAGERATRYNLYDYKKELLAAYRPGEDKRGVIGIPMGLNMFELLPFWHTFFTALGFRVVTSPASDRALYLQGQNSIPSDTVCFPAKMMHGHIQTLIDSGVDTIFYPCMSYNLDEDLGDNHYNCPVVAYYPEVIAANQGGVKQIRFIGDYVGPHRRKDFPRLMHKTLSRYFIGITPKEVKAAADSAYAEYERFMGCIRQKGEEYLAVAKEKGLPVIILAGRPYHLDAEINHGIDTLICDLGAVVVSEEAVCHLAKKEPVKVLNQWTYHARLYAAAHLVRDWDDPAIQLVQLVSFGCGVDAITTDEVRRILEEKSKIYTLIKIDEITNLGAVKIRLRSLFSALGLGKEAAE